MNYKLETVAGDQFSNVAEKAKQIATEKNSKVGELQMILRVFLVGSKMGPGLFIIAETIGKTNTLQRIENALKVFVA